MLVLTCSMRHVRAARQNTPAHQLTEDDSDYACSDPGHL